MGRMHVLSFKFGMKLRTSNKNCCKVLYDKPSSHHIHVELLMLAHASSHSLFPDKQTHCWVHTYVFDLLLHS